MAADGILGLGLYHIKNRQSDLFMEKAYQ